MTRGYKWQVTKHTYFGVDMNVKLRDAFVIILLSLTAAILLTGLLEHINLYQVSVMKLDAAKSEREAAIYLEQSEMLRHEDVVLQSNMYRMNLRIYLINNGIKEKDVDRFIEENSK